MLGCVLSVLTHPGTTNDFQSACKVRNLASLPPHHPPTWSELQHWCGESVPRNAIDWLGGKRPLEPSQLSAALPSVCIHTRVSLRYQAQLSRGLSRVLCADCCPITTDRAPLSAVFGDVRTPSKGTRPWQHVRKTAKRDISRVENERYAICDRYERVWSTGEMCK